VIRVLLIPFFSDDFNYWAYRVPSSFVVEGFNPYIAICKDPTLYWINPWRQTPTYLVFLVPAYVLGSVLQNEIIFLYAIKIPFIIGDLITAFFLFKIALILSEDAEKAKKICMLYAFNPLTIFASAIWGVSDPIPISLTVISLYYFLCSPSKSKIEFPAFLMGLGIAFKLYPVFILPAFLIKIRRWKKAVVFIFFASLPPALSSLPFFLWNPESFSNRLFSHNLSGMFPLFPVILIENPIIKIALSLLISIFFIIAYTRKSSIIANIVLSFLALYLALGGMLAASYFLWIIPFSTLLLLNKRVNATRGSMLLFFFPIPSMVWSLIYNGPFNSVEGVTGIFYWPYHWLRSKVVVFRVFTFLQNTAPLFVAINIAMILYLFFIVFKIAPSFTVRKAVRGGLLNCFSTLNKLRKWLFASALIFVMTLFLFSNVVPFEPMKSMPVLSQSTFVFFDDFSNSLLNYQWWFSGEGTYALYPCADPSYITLNAPDLVHNRAYIFRGWWDVTNGFYNSSDAIVEFRFKFNRFSDNASNMIIAKTDGGFFGAKIQGNLNSFVYFDEISNQTQSVAVLNSEWQTFKIVYDGKRYVYLNNELVVVYNTQSTFSMLFLGNSESSETFGGGLSIDWVTVILKDFPAGIQDNLQISFALAFPFTVLILIVGVLHLANNFSRLSLPERKLQISEFHRDEKQWNKKWLHS
jgi:hypothetical protein